MRRERTAPLGNLIPAIVASLCGLILIAPAYAQSRQLKKLVGKWELSTKAEPSDKRLVTFAIDGGQLTGTYTDEDSKKLPITDIIFANGKYSFRVSDANLVFRDFEFVGSNLEGSMLPIARRRGSGVPQVVQMVRKSR